jgi:hypothetical protein
MRMKDKFNIMATIMPCPDQKLLNRISCLKKHMKSSGRIENIR